MSPQFDLQLVYDQQCYKVILCDKSDEIVDLQASFLVGVAREVAHHQRVLRKKEILDGRMGVEKNAKFYVRDDQIGMFSDEQVV